MWSYMPILKWKQGEKLALRHLHTAQWDGTAPLVELLPIDAAPTRNGIEAALIDYLDPIVKEIKKSIPKDAVLAIDTRYVSVGYADQLQLLANICGYLTSEAGRLILPTIDQTIIGDGTPSIAALDGFDEIIVRIAIDAVAPNQVPDIIDSVVSRSSKDRVIHIIIDQFAIVGADPAVQSAFVQPYLDAALAAEQASVALAGGSFPVNLIGIKQGLLDIPRAEWRTWELIHALPEYEVVLFSDYAVSHPALQGDMEPTKVNPSVQIRYCATDTWRLYKAGGFKLGPPNQYRNLCSLLIADPIYSGRLFSFGDTCYDDAATGAKGNGNPSSWRKDATNHHLVFTRQAL